jgi:hypothetical protein
MAPREGVNSRPVINSSRHRQLYDFHDLESQEFLRWPFGLACSTDLYRAFLIRSKPFVAIFFGAVERFHRVVRCGGRA